MVTSYLLMPMTVLWSGPLVANFGPQVIVVTAATMAIVATALTLSVLWVLPGVRSLPGDSDRAQEVKLSTASVA
ncbi:hypothetical protein [Actinomadura sp. CNU-125]|uniref:hypothetical protein n=1 Tax=Actinomadura sp. CNU-125 TaxID=1904961 RepID=UPI00096AA437|nr:hypothetical protein [Actinomadura sp. CNU-125]